MIESKVKIKDGFTLVELALVMVIIGILIVGGLKMLGPLVKRVKRTSAIETINAGVEAVAGFAEVNDRIPLDFAEFEGVVRNSTDVWGEDLVYIPASDLTAVNSICERNSTDLTIEFCEDAACAVSNITEDVAYLILSGGSNMNIQTDTTLTSVKVYDYGMFGVDDYASGLNRAEPYDDVLKWVVLPELRVKAGCLGGQIKILNTEIPSSYVLTAYETDIFALDGVPWADGDASSGDADEDTDYRWCVEEAAPSGLSYACNGLLADSSATGCSYDIDTSTETGSWNQCTNLTIAGNPDLEGAYSLPVYVRDDAGNITNRTFVLSISVIAGIHLCDEYMVWNNINSSRDYTIDGGCYTIGALDEITGAASGLGLNSGETILQHDGSSGSCASGSPLFIRYTDAVLADNNMDCCVVFDLTDKVCP